MRGSLAAFAPILDRTFCSASISEILSHENSAGVPAPMDQLFPTEITACVREMIDAVVSGSERLGEIRKRVIDWREEVLAERPSAASQKEALTKVVALLASGIGEDLVAEMKKALMDDKAQLGYLKLRADQIVRGSLGFALPDFGEPRISQLATARFTYASLWYSLRWPRLGGMEGVKPAKVANDTFDLEYVLTASYL